MSNAYKIIHYFISGASSREIKEKVWKWLIDSHGQPEKEAALKQCGMNPATKQIKALQSLIVTSAAKLP